MKIDLVSGALTIAIGVVVALLSTQYRIGTLNSMGTGYFPLALSILLILLGLALLVGGLRQSKIRMSFPPIRPTLLILAAPIVFALLVGRFGLAVAVIAIALLGAFAHEEGSYVEKLLTVSGVTAAAVMVFAWGIGLAIPIFQWGLQ